MKNSCHIKKMSACDLITTTDITSQQYVVADKTKLRKISKIDKIEFELKKKIQFTISILKSFINSSSKKNSLYEIE